jgi:hypothetical protein
MMPLGWMPENIRKGEVLTMAGWLRLSLSNGQQSKGFFF